MAIVNARIVNQKNLERALLQAFEIWAEEDINNAHWDDQFKDDKWNYGWVTERRNGETVGSPRNIYDLGKLYESGIDSYKFSISGNKAEASWHWDAKNASGKEYAWYVHEGAGTNVTARPFTDDISIPSSFFSKAPGMALLRRVQQELNQINAR